MSEERKTLKDAPLSQWVEVRLRKNLNPKKVKCIFLSEIYAIVVDENGEEFVMYTEEPFTYPIDPIEELENKILDLWQGQDASYMWDEWKDIPHRWILQVMVDAGADIERVK